MNCQRFKPAEFKFVTPVGAEKNKINKGVPQINLDILKVSETFHAPPANAVSYEVLSNYPPEDTPIPDRVPRFYTAFQSGNVKPANFVSKYQEITVNTTPKIPVESVKHKGQRLLG